jgi:ATP-dependent DNA helicase RecG
VVGINVPNATVIMIENAERFGLAGLHQLRGRVGRGNEQSYCILMSDSKNETTKERLQILKESNDGFYISEQDLKLRGPGDMLGVRQSGDMGFAIADIYADASVLKLASDMSSELLLADPELANEDNKGIKEKLKEYMNNGFCRINL